MPIFQIPSTLTLIHSLLVTLIICCTFFTLSFCDGVIASAATTFINCDKTFSCGSITNVTFPFTGGDRPDHCGLPEFRLNCQQPNNVTELTHNSVTYRVLQLDQTLKRLTLSRSDLYNTTCLSHFTNSTLNSTFFSFGDQDDDNLTIIYGCNSPAMSSKPQNLFSCSIPRVNFTDAYYIVGPIPSDPIFRSTHCSVCVTVPILRSVEVRLTSDEISLSEALMQGFSVNYSDPYEKNCAMCTRVGRQCGFDSDLGQPACVCGDRFCALPPPLLSEDRQNASAALQGRKRRLNLVTGLLIAVAGIMILGGIFYCLLKRCSWWEAVIYWKSDGRNNQQVEAFMRNYGSVAPKWYKYSEIKKMTNSFAKKLGHGGYGSVYRGKLSDGRLVAVKVLNDNKGNGEEFINEVASISRTSHVNVVNLLGFCYDRTKRALVYEFMPNGSLDRFMHHERSSLDTNTDCQLEWKTLYEIAVGTARGLEYLHQGCNTRIVHFDIKPQNILLDKDFCPKISDFGLARLCKQKQSILSTIGARGTAGYIAPEVFCRNFGGISHKSDVYSYGMTLLEIVGLRRKIGPDSEQTSERYFPNWIYEELELGKDLEIQGVMNEEEEEISRKMVLVGLWCIQTNPADRPSMSKVVEMLEGSLEHLKIPPKPCLDPPSMARESTQESWASSNSIS